MDMNQVNFVGRLTVDPELLHVGKDNTPLCKFRLAVNRKRGENHQVTFIDCDAWHRVAEIIAQYTQKGSELRVTGWLRQDTWTDANDNKRSKHIVVAEDVSLGARPRDATTTDESYEQSDNVAASRNNDRDRGRKKAVAGRTDTPFKEGVGDAPMF
jgi:single-strand DNA-binding protein